MTPQTIPELLAKVKDCEAEANIYWRDNRDFHDSDGVDVNEVFKAGHSAACAVLVPALEEMDAAIRGIESSMNANGVPVSYEPLREKIRAILESAVRE